mgnify:CR=1 FL=1
MSYKKVVIIVKVLAYVFFHSVRYQNCKRDFRQVGNNKRQHACGKRVNYSLPTKRRFYADKPKRAGKVTNQKSNNHRQENRVRFFAENFNERTRNYRRENKTNNISARRSEYYAHARAEAAEYGYAYHAE